jgi:hypothetical protein
VSVRVALIAAIAACALLAGCGEDGEEGQSGEALAEELSNADPDDVQVIADWAEALAAGDVEEAAGHFALPSIAENGITFELETVEQVEAFNESLPCGAELIDAETEGDFTTATFELKERPGAGRCGSGTGNTAQTSFVIEDGLIVEWRRVALPGQQASGQAS